MGFPLDPDLPSLIGATDRRGVAELLGAALQEKLGPNFAIRDCQVDLVDCGRQQRATLRYHVTSRAASDSAAEPRRLALQNAEGIASAVAPIMRRLARIGSPVVSF